MSVRTWFLFGLATSAPAAVQHVWTSTPAPSNLSGGRLVAGQTRLVSAGIETWEWNGTAWSLRSIPTQASAIRELVDDPLRPSEALAIGSRFDSASQRYELVVSEYDLTGWREWPDEHVPIGFVAHGFYDTAREELVAVGTDGRSPLTTWVHDGQAWQLRDANGPPGRYSLAIAFDEARGRAVLYGGATDNAAMPLGDTWEWNGVRWQQLSPAATPGPRSPTDLVFDRARARVVLYGGGTFANPRSDVWEWDGITWAELATTGQPPPPGLEQDVAYERHEQLVLVTFDRGVKTTWTLVNPTPARVARFGRCCFGCIDFTQNGRPGLNEDWNRPWLGDTWTLRAGGAPRPHTAVLLLGGSRTAWGSVQLPLSLGFLGSPQCSLYVSPDVVLPATLVSFWWTTPVPVPDRPELLGHEIHAQFLGLVAQGSFQLVQTSDAVTGTVGRR